MPETLRQTHFAYQATRPFVPEIPLQERKIDVSTEELLLKNPNREKLGSDAFNLEYDARPSRAELRRDIVSYLGEYRLQVQKYNYDLIYGRDKDHRGEVTLRDQDRGESLRRMAKRTLQSRKIEGKPTHREEAEEVGLQHLNDQLRFSQNGDAVIWASPPGPKDQGYGEYGFVYAGKVQLMDNGERQVAMTAIRVEKPKQADGADPWITQIGNVVNALSGESREYRNAEDFLASPKLIRSDVADHVVDSLLQKSFEFSPNEKEQEQMAAIIKQMDPLIEEFISRMETGTPAERLKAFYTLENYALELKKQGKNNNQETVVYTLTTTQPTLDSLITAYSHIPPPVAGSCGKTGSTSNNISFMGGSRIGPFFGGGSKKDQYGDLDFECPSGHKNTRPEGKLIPNCTTCGVSVSC